MGEDAQQTLETTQLVRHLNARVVQLDREGSYRSALSLAREAESQERRQLPPLHPLQLTCRLNLAALCQKLDYKDEVRQFVREAIEVAEGMGGQLKRDRPPLSAAVLLSYEDDLNRLILLVQRLAVWCESAAEYHEAKYLWVKIAVYRSWLLGANH